MILDDGPGCSDLPGFIGDCPHEEVLEVFPNGLDPVDRSAVLAKSIEKRLDLVGVIGDEADASDITVCLAAGLWKFVDPGWRWSGTVDLVSPAVGRQVIDRALHGHLSLHEDGDAIADHLQFAQQVAVEEDRHALVPQFQQEVADFAAADWIHSIGRFIEDDQVRGVDQCLCEPDPLQHSLGITAKSLVCPLGHAHAIQQSARVLSPLRSVHTGHGPAELDDLSPGEVVGEVVVFGEVPDPCEGLLVSNGQSKECSFDLVGAYDGHEDLHEGRFAGTIGSQEAEDLAALDFHLHASKRQDPSTEGLSRVLDVDDVLGAGHDPGSTPGSGSVHNGPGSSCSRCGRYPPRVATRPLRNLREFLEALEQAGELHRVAEPVSPILEITEVADRHSKSPASLASSAAARFDPGHAHLGGKALLFEQVEGCDFPLAINIYGSYARTEMALGCHGEGGFDSIASRLEILSQPKPPSGLRDTIRMGRQFLPLLRAKPKMVRSAPCQQVVKLVEQDEVRLSRLPMLKCWPHDGDPAAVGIPFEQDGARDGGGRYITFAGVHTIHADDRNEDRPASHNIGTYRVQLLDDTRMCMHWHIHHDGAAHWRSWKAIGERMPVAICFGGESVLPYASTAPLPPGISELLLAGFLNGGGIPMARARTVPLRVPANSEIVIEGWVRTDAGGIGWDPRGDEPLGPGAAFEGPFGDHTGFYSMPDRYPVLEVTAVTHRRDAIFPATVVGIPPQEDYYLGKATERIFLPLLRTLVPDIVDYHLPMFGSFHQCVFVQVRKAYPLQARRVMHAIWGAGQMAWTKMIVVVDESVNVHDERAVLEAIARHAEFPRDLEIVNGPLDILDHSAPRLGAGGKMGIDATESIPGEEVGGVPVGSPPPARIDAVVSQLASLGDREGIAACHVPEWGLGRVVLAAVDASQPGRSSRAIESIFGVVDEGADLVIVVDGDVDPTDHERVLFMLCANMDPLRDRHDHDHRLGLDGTSKHEGPGRNEEPVRPWPPIIRMDPEVQSRVESRRGVFGLSSPG